MNIAVEYGRFMRVYVTQVVASSYPFCFALDTCCNFATGLRNTHRYKAALCDEIQSLNDTNQHPVYG